ncbi:SDR family oxidoreductase [Dokdonia sp. LLG6352-1]|uniref:SDR family oxidoreductase n=1 Tax=Dokdonia sp. LLG6352-1 TaxID=3160831 RepID=UPI003868311E
MDTDLTNELEGKRILVTGGAGFIGSNICEVLINNGAIVTCLDNFATGHRYNLDAIIDHSNFTFIEGDIRDVETCKKAVSQSDYVLHQAALGSVPRSIKDPATSNEVNVGGFLNMLIASKDKGVKRFVYAASSSTYGDSQGLPKQEDIIGKPLSPYAITKYVNELYADVFHKTYGIDCIGLRYFNVFGRKQDPNGAYAAVIPKFTNLLMNQESPVINGDGSYSRDFTYIDNVIEMNIRAMLSKNKEALNTVYNVAYGERIDLMELIRILKKELSFFDASISNIEVIFGPNRVGDVPHSLADISKAKKLLGYNPEYSVRQGLVEAVKWYYDNLV